MNTNTNPSLQIVDFTIQDQEDFETLNQKWIEKFFEMEESDHKILKNPKTSILDQGGVIKMARYDDKTVGTCALIKIEERVYELAKMAISEEMRGKGIGYQLGLAVLKKARNLDAKKVFLFSNRSLEAALHIYTKMGFREVPIDPSKNDYKRSDIQMEIEL